MRRILFGLIGLLALAQEGSGQKLKKADRVTQANLQSEIRFLADDKLEGRRAGTAGEKLAADYISGVFQKLQLQPYGTDHSWTQPFGIYDGKKIAAGTYFKVNGKELEAGKDYFPLPYSAQKSVQGSPAVALQESGEPWFADLKDLVDANQNNPHFILENALPEKVKEFARKGATAVIFYNSGSPANDIRFEAKDRTVTASIPVLFVVRDAKKKFFKDESASLDLGLAVSFEELSRTGNNVIGYIDNKAPSTIIIGAHYDHLGYGEDGGSLYRGSDKEIHNGADDNASGTAALLELARLLKQSKLRKHNYLLIAFSGEELGLFGSKYFVDHPTVDLNQVTCMINMDMVGRLNDSTHTLTIGGYGTSPVWGELMAAKQQGKNLNLKFDSSGTGPSDYTSFYRKDIPVLFFFTGLHSDYHRPSDDYDKINYTGEVYVIRFIYDLLDELNDRDKIAFTKTREVQTGTAARFSVTLGIMPDYTYSGTGVRLDGVSDGRPAQKAGLKTGDIITKLGDYPVNSLEGYMQALSKFKKGDKAVVEYRRGENAAKADVEF